jgi:hypothetical protein
MRQSAFVAARSVPVGALCMALATSGCSFAFVTAPPKEWTHLSEREPDRPAGETSRASVESSGPSNPQGEEIDCTESPAAPIADTFVAVPFLGLGALAFVATGASNQGHTGGNYAGILLLAGAVAVVVGGIYAGSAVYGYSATGSCAERHEEQRKRRKPVEEASPGCMGDGECQAGWVCKAGACTAPPPECSTDADCQRARYCINGRCE